MCVQPNAVARKAIPYMVLYCLTPPQFHRYSSLTLCPPCPAWGEKNDGMDDDCIVFGGGGTRLVNRSSRRARSQNPHVSQRTRNMGHPARVFTEWQLATDNWPLFLRSSRCSN